MYDVRAGQIGSEDPAKMKIQWIGSSEETVGEPRSGLVPGKVRWGQNRIFKIHTDQLSQNRSAEFGIVHLILQQECLYQNNTTVSK